MTPAESHSPSTTRTSTMLEILIDGVVHSIKVDDTSSLFEAILSNMHPSSALKFLPATLHKVPPLTPPVVGLIEFTWTSPTTSKLAGCSITSRPLLLMCRDHVPNVKRGRSQMTTPELSNTPGTSVPLPNLHVKSLESTKWWPYTVISICPRSGPREGTKVCTSGASMNAKITSLDENAPSDPITSTAAPPLMCAGVTQTSMLDVSTDLASITCSPILHRPDQSRNPLPIT